jgi:EXPERA (EXPanded EBP superfamily)
VLNYLPTCVAGVPDREAVARRRWVKQGDRAVTATTDQQGEREAAGTSRLSSLQKALIGVAAFYFGIIPVFWYLEVHLDVSHGVASNTMTVLHILAFATALSLPWLRLPGQRVRTKSQRLDAMVIVWIFICLIPRFIWELPWLLFLDQIRSGVQSGALWTYIWSPYLQGGDARYLNGDPLVVTLEWIALFVGMFETYATVQFFRNGKRFTNNQLSFIMGGMIVEVLLPAVYFGTEIANEMKNVSSPVDMWIKFVLLNIFWCTMPLVTYFWGVRRLASQNLEVTF